MAKTIDVSDLPEALVKTLECFVNAYRDKTATCRTPEVPPIGWLKGKWEVPDSFFESLPDELLGPFNGNGEQP